MICLHTAFHMHFNGSLVIAVIMKANDNFCKVAMLFYSTQNKLHYRKLHNVHLSIRIQHFRTLCQLAVTYLKFARPL
jgi:hypothetical protein